MSEIKEKLIEATCPQKASNPPASDEINQIVQKSQHKDVSENDSEFSYLLNLSLMRKFVFLLQLPSFVALTLSAAVRNMGGYALGGWLQVFLVRSHGLSASDFLIWLIFIIPIGGAGGAAVGKISSTNQTKISF